ncbi:MAG TPA: four helix bundle protein [Dehalococcoidia bacterium]|nr:four helix bundle protein [Dehalococcoidia bacterium]
METGSEKREDRSGDRRAARVPIRSYRDLDVYQRSMNLLRPLQSVLAKLPAVEQYELASQMRRASKSIPANIAEGYGRKRSAKEFKFHLGVALGSANEMIVHLEIAVAVGYAEHRDVGELIAAYEVLARQLYRLLEKWQDFGADSARREERPASRVSHLASS